MTQSNGSPGNDTLYGGKGIDRIDGGAGIDTYVASNFFGIYSIDRDASTGEYLLQRNGEATVRLANVERLRFLDGEYAIDEAFAGRNVTIRGEHGNTVNGSDLATSLFGFDGGDTLQGNGGDDGLYGGKGQDTAAFRGARGDYVVEHDLATGLYRVRDTVAGRDGTDTLAGIEQLRFADGTFAIGELARDVGEAPREVGTAPIIAPIDSTGDVSDSVVLKPAPGAYLTFTGSPATDTVVLHPGNGDPIEFTLPSWLSGAHVWLVPSGAPIDPEVDFLFPANGTATLYYPETDSSLVIMGDGSYQVAVDLPGVASQPLDLVFAL